jgi:predicted transposase/invertase (TIGR01784 family)
MRRDSIFYKIFSSNPALIFELLPTAPANANDYQFDSVAVKEPKFEIDGVFIPPQTDGTGVVYFCEVQFQKDEQLYERVFAESHLYFYRNRKRYSDWEAVIIYPSRSLEQNQVRPYRSLLGGDQVHRVYLDELGDIRSLPLGLALMVLTMLSQDEAPQEARYMLERTRQEVPDAAPSRAIIELITTILVYKFTQLNRREVETMMGIRLQDTRVYQEAQEEMAVRLIARQLTRLLGQDISEEMLQRISNLSLPVLENLSEALFDFTSLTDLQAWLDAQSAIIS